MTDKQKKDIAEAMKLNKLQKAFVTSDGSLFASKNAAENHARTFNGKKREKALDITEVNDSDLKPEKPEKQDK